MVMICSKENRNFITLFCRVKYFENLPGLTVIIAVATSILSIRGEAILQTEVDNSTMLEWYLANLPHHREKRFIWMTEKKKLVLPPGTQLVLTPTLAMPLLRYPPTGIDANLTISTPFTSE